MNSTRLGETRIIEIFPEVEACGYRANGRTIWLVKDIGGWFWASQRDINRAGYFANGDEDDYTKWCQASKDCSFYGGNDSYDRGSSSFLAACRSAERNDAAVEELP